MSTTSVTLYSIEESSIHLMDLLSLARQKYLALYQEDNIRLLPEVLQAEFIKSVRRNCRAPQRDLVKRGVSDFEHSEDVRSSEKSRRPDSEEPVKKRKKDNLMGPFSSQDFLSHSYENPIIDFSALSTSPPTIVQTPKRPQESRKLKCATRKSGTCPDVFQRLATPKMRK